MKKIFIFTCLLLSPTLSMARTAPNTYLETINIARSPSTVTKLTFESGLLVEDTDVSPKGGIATILLKKGGTESILFWDYIKNVKDATWEIPENVNIKAIAWHPRGEYLYAIQHNNNNWMIVRNKATSTSWDPEIIFKSKSQLRRLVFSTSLFGHSYLSSKESPEFSFRLYFGSRTIDGKWEIKSIRELGDGAYSMIGPNPTMVAPDAGIPEQKPNQFSNGSMLPVSFHISGSILLVENEKNCFSELIYNSGVLGATDWSEPQAYKANGLQLCNGSLTFVPNGTGVFQWQKGESGILYINFGLGYKKKVAQGFSFISTPSSTPDGVGVVGVASSNGKQEVVYTPVDVPLGDVSNAWLFDTNMEETDRIAKFGGLLKTGEGVQLYNLYDTETYNNSDNYGVKRPYLVTTDVFWENFGAAFEAAFILNERRLAMPSFEKLLKKSRNYFGDKIRFKPGTNAEAERLYKLFTVSECVLTGNPAPSKELNDEVEKVYKASSSGKSSILDRSVNYAQFRPRGHYTKTEEDSRYFSAMRFLTFAQLNKSEAKLIAKMPQEIQNTAKSWIAAYTPYIALPRGATVWDIPQNPIADSIQKQNQYYSFFPLSWAADNETFYRGTYHLDDPKSIKSQRFFPSGLDFGYVFGSAYAKEALKDEFKKFPDLLEKLDELKNESVVDKASQSKSMYDQWLSGLASQFDAKVSNSDSNALLALDKSSAELWAAKRLQTGLSSWATLRHATILVNDPNVAEGGEGGWGFEALIIQPPKGSVEPDINTWNAIFNLYGKLSKSFEISAQTWPKTDDSEQLRNSMIVSFSKMQKIIEQFRDIAIKQIDGSYVSPEDYALISRVGGIIEHDFVKMKSVQIGGYGLSNPDPIGKIADVSSFQDTSLEVAVGDPVEWDQLVRFYGRRQLVKGSVYGYYEFKSNIPMNDSEWINSQQKTPRPTWINKFFTNH